MSISDDSHLRPRLIPEERRWRERPSPPALADGRASRITLSRWAAVNADELVEVSSDAVDEAHVISFATHDTVAELRIGKAILKSGFVPARTIFISGPIAQHCHSVFYRKFSFLQIHFPQALMAECFEYAYGRPPSSDLILFGPQYINDIAIEHLVQSLMSLDDDVNLFASLFMDGIGLALATRLISAHAGDLYPQIEKPRSGLAKWRLNRTIEYIDAHLSEPIRLGDLSQVAGLSRMHFAAQFRMATGLTPHTYIVRRRIAMAQELLRNRSFSLIDVAFVTGFSSQSHFAGVFKKYVGETPRRWRDAVLGSSAAKTDRFTAGP